MIAEHEQRNIVERVYTDHAQEFTEMSRADYIDFLNDRTSIPVAKTCTRNNLVPFSGDISNADNRVDYYGQLIDRMYQIEGIGQ